MINLLPPEQIKELKQEEIFKLVLTLGIIVLAFLVSLVLILFLIKTLLLIDLNAQEISLEQKQKELKDSEMRELEEKIKQYNLALSGLEIFYESQPELTSILDKISRVFPEGTYLTSFKFSSQTSQVSLTGFSPNSETLLKFKENLEKTEGLKDLSFPEDLWIQENNINFLVSFKI